MRKNDRVDHHGIVHLVRDGTRWRDSPAEWIYGAVYVCLQVYRSSFPPTITRKKPVTCLWCLTGRSRI